MTVKPAPPVVRFKQPDPARDLLAFVTVASTIEVRVRIRRRGSSWRWVCDRCGRNTRPICSHVEATMAALRVAILEEAP